MILDYANKIMLLSLYTFSVSVYMFPVYTIPVSVYTISESVYTIPVSGYIILTQLRSDCNQTGSLAAVSLGRDKRVDSRENKPLSSAV